MAKKVSIGEIINNSLVNVGDILPDISVDITDIRKAVMETIGIVSIYSSDLKQLIVLDILTVDDIIEIINTNHLHAVIEIIGEVPSCQTKEVFEALCVSGKLSFENLVEVSRKMDHLKVNEVIDVMKKYFPYNSKVLTRKNLSKIVTLSMPQPMRKNVFSTIQPKF